MAFDLTNNGTSAVRIGAFGMSMLADTSWGAMTTEEARCWCINLFHLSCHRVDARLQPTTRLLKDIRGWSKALLPGFVPMALSAWWQCLPTIRRGLKLGVQCWRTTLQSRQVALSQYLPMVGYHMLPWPGIDLRVDRGVLWLGK